MLIAIDGVPGTGKSAVSKELSKMIKAEIIDIKDIAVRNQMVDGLDEKRMSIVINENRISSAIKKETKEKGKYILDSHLAHFTNKKLVKLLIILRCNPKVLEKRLEKRKYSKAKVAENAMAEYLDTILIESLKRGYRNRIHEIDTTNKEAKNIAKEIVGVLNNKKKKGFGKISWF